MCVWQAIKGGIKRKKLLGVKRIKWTFKVLAFDYTTTDPSCDSGTVTMSEHADVETADSIIHCTSANDYYTALESAGDRLVVVDCYAPWCPPCQQIAPIFERLAGEYPHVVFIKVDMDQAGASLKSELGVWALPTFCFFRRGRKVGSFMGANVALLRQGLEHDGRVSMCSMCGIQ